MARSDFEFKIGAMVLMDSRHMSLPCGVHRAQVTACVPSRDYEAQPLGTGEEMCWKVEAVYADNTVHVAYANKPCPPACTAWPMATRTLFDTIQAQSGTLRHNKDRFLVREEAFKEALVATGAGGSNKLDTIVDLLQQLVAK